MRNFHRKQKTEIPSYFEQLRISVQPKLITKAPLLPEERFHQLRRLVFYFLSEEDPIDQEERHSNAGKTQEYQHRHRGAA